MRELKLYLDHYGIEEGRYKEDNVRLVKAHIGSMLLNEMVPERSDPDEIRSNQNSDDDSGGIRSGLDEDLSVSTDKDTSSDDEIVNVIETLSSSSSEESHAEENQNVENHRPTSRYGRRRADFHQKGFISWDNIQLDHR